MLKLRQILFFRCKKISQTNGITKNNEKYIKKLLKYRDLKNLRFKQVMSRICVVFILISSSTLGAQYRNSRSSRGNERAAVIHPA